MKEKFTKDIEKASGRIRMDDTDYTDPVNKDDRIFIALYLIETQLSWIRGLLWVIAILLFAVVFKL